MDAVKLNATISIEVSDFVDQETGENYVKATLGWTEGVKVDGLSRDGVTSAIILALGNLRDLLKQGLKTQRYLEELALEERIEACFPQKWYVPPPGLRLR